MLSQIFQGMNTWSGEKRLMRTNTQNASVEARTLKLVDWSRPNKGHTNDRHLDPNVEKKSGTPPQIRHGLKGYGDSGTQAQAPVVEIF